MNGYPSPRLRIVHRPLDLDELFAQVDDLPVRGGCRRCDSYLTMQTTTGQPGLVTIHHESWCPMNPRPPEENRR